jgi:hypothetical protein
LVLPEVKTSNYTATGKTGPEPKYAAPMGLWKLVDSTVLLKFGPAGPGEAKHYFELQNGLLFFRHPERGVN